MVVEEKQTNTSGTLAQGWLLHRAPFCCTWKRSWATLSIPQKYGLRLPVLTLQDNENGKLIASLPLQRSCLISSVCSESAPALIEQAPFETPRSLLPHEWYYSFSIEWQTQGHSRHENMNGMTNNPGTSVVVVPNNNSRSDIKKALSSLASSSMLKYSNSSKE